MLAEVKAYMPYKRDSGLGNASPPNIPGEICAFGGGEYTSGHTEWVDGRTHQSGFTATFPPNTLVSCDFIGSLTDIDYNNSRVGVDATKVTYAAVKARSYHAGEVVNVAMVDGSVHVISSMVESFIWTAMATRDGGEIAENPFE